MIWTLAIETHGPTKWSNEGEAGCLGILNGI
jgi:hypothetical protein